MSGMNPGLIALGSFVAFILLQGTDFFIHAKLLSGYYGNSKQLWREEKDMMPKMWANFVGHAVVAVSFTLLFQFAVVSNGGGIPCALVFAFVLTLQQAGGSFIMWSVQPLPASYYIKWGIATLIQCAAVSIALYFILPKTAAG